MNAATIGAARHSKQLKFKVMAKVQKGFQFTYNYTIKSVRNLRIVRDHVAEFQVSGIVTDNKGAISVDIDSIIWDGKDVLPLIVHMPLFSDIETAALLHAKKEFGAVDKYKQCVEMILAYIGNEYLYFDSELLYLDGVNRAFFFWGVAVTSDNEIWIMDGDQHWTKVDHTDAGIVEQLHKRMVQISAKYAVKK